MEPDTRLGPYEIVRQLGAGGMGEVYLAQDTRLGRQVAIKVLPAQFAADPERLARFEREARAAAALNHPNIAVIHDIGSATDAEGRTVHYMVQELLEGRTLRERLDAGPMPLREALEVARDTARALASAHASGIVHRDLKPENLFLTQDGHTKVLDFGLAKLTETAPMGSGDPSLSPTVVGTTVGQLLGTAGYMAPEQVRGEAVDGRTDVFAFGCVLHEMLTGRRAFAGRTMHQTLDFILNDEPQEPGDAGTAIPDRLDWIRRKCLDKDPARRYQHADDLAVDLGRCADALAAGDLAATSPAAAVSGNPPGVLQVLASIPGLALVAITATAVAAAALANLGGRGEVIVPDPVRLTQFTTTVSGVAVSPNGQMLAMIVAEPTSTDTQVWIKTLPDGPPLQLTRTPGVKGMPAFSPDGSRIAYTEFHEAWRWDTWVVPIVGGEPRLLMRNANSLTWTPDGRVIFSEFREGYQLAIVMADESGADREDVWVPLPNQMAHFSQVSPDGKSVVIGYMGVGPYSPDSDACFERPLHGGDDDVRLIGGEHGCLRSVRYSPDGRWIYFLTRHGDVMREPAGGGSDELVFRSGVTMAVVGFVAVAVAPTGDAIYLPAGERSRNVWRTTPTGYREQLTYEGDAESPVFSVDGRYVYYSLKLSGESGGDQIWGYDLRTGQREHVCPGLDARQIAPAPDGRHLVVTRVVDGTSSLWTCTLDGSEPSRRLVDADTDQGDPVFSPDGATLYFGQRLPKPATGAEAGGSRASAAGVTSGALFRVGFDGSDPRQISAELVGDVTLLGVSPDGAFLNVLRDDVTPKQTWLYPTDGGAPRLVLDEWSLRWAPDNSSWLFVSRGMVTTSWVLENPDHAILPPGLPQHPDRAWLEKVGARQALVGLWWNPPVLSPTPYELVYGRLDFRSNLYRQDIVR